ncbi:MAG: HYR domain-containing protein, partial [Acidobacteriota bacterium]|nr:HYR domain-containing protein [Acidobacteriota bacterium]
MRVIPRRFRLVARAGVLTCLALTACSRSATPTGPSAQVKVAVAAPTVACPASIDLTTMSTSVPVTYQTPTAEGGEVPVTVACTPPSGEPFRLGSTAVRCTATDRGGQTGSCGFTVSVSRLPTLSKTRFLAFGDSVTVGIVATENPARDPFYFLREVPNDSYPSVLRQLLAGRYGTQDVTVINDGRGGEKAVDGVGRAYSAIRTHRPDVLLLLDGYNDLGLGDAGVAPG